MTANAIPLYCEGSDECPIQEVMFMQGAAPRRSTYVHMAENCSRSVGLSLASPAANRESNYNKAAGFFERHRLAGGTRSRQGKPQLAEKTIIARGKGRPPLHNWYASWSGNSAGAINLCEVQRVCAEIVRLPKQTAHAIDLNQITVRLLGM
jgi:hypothetical protein